MLRQQHRFFRSVLMASDATLVVVSTIAAYYGRFAALADFGHATVNPRFATYAIPPLLAVPVIVGTMIGMGLYRARRDQRFFWEAVAIMKAVAVGSMILIAALTLLRDLLYDGRNLSALQFALFSGFLCVLLLAWRFSFRHVLRVLRKRGWNLRHVAIIGTGRLGQVVYHTLKRNSWTGITPNFFISHHATTTRAKCLDMDLRGGLDDLEKTLDSNDLSGVIIALPARMAAELPGILLRLERFPLDVRIVPDMNPRHMPMNMATHELEGMPILSVRESPLNGWGRVTKRTLDLVGSIVALAIFAIPMIAFAAMIRAGGRGPVIFRQERMSLNGQKFRIFKFRTMEVANAEQQILVEANTGTEAWTDPADARVTKIGKFLRRTSLDELPQLFNVLLGEMSLVGPRPERPELIQRFREDWRGYMLRQNVKSGMTGWAQVNGLRGRTSLRKRLQYDLFYIRNWSLMFDLRILWMTIFRGFVHPNAY